MKQYKTFEWVEMPQNIKDSLDESFRQNSYFRYYPGDGYFKAPEEFRDISTALKYQDYMYEPGDDPVGDWLMLKGAELCEEVLILVNW